MKLLVTAGLCCFVNVANSAPAAAEPQVIITGIEARRIVDHRTDWSPRRLPRLVRPWCPLDVSPQAYERRRVLAARVTTFLGWPETELVLYVGGPLSHRVELERIAQELLADPAASAVQRQLAEDLLERLRGIPIVVPPVIPPVMIVE